MRFRRFPRRSALAVGLLLAGGCAAPQCTGNIGPEHCQTAGDCQCAGPGLFSYCDYAPECVVAACTNGLCDYAPTSTPQVPLREDGGSCTTATCQKGQIVHLIVDAACVPSDAASTDAPADAALDAPGEGAADGATDAGVG
jgi:hypothetical protein